MNPDILRTEKDAVSLVRKFADSGKVIAAICHGPWMLIEAGVIKGPPGDVLQFDQNRHDECRRTLERCRGRNRRRHHHQPSPKDLEAFVSKIIEEIGEGRHDRRAA